MLRVPRATIVLFVASLVLLAATFLYAPTGWVARVCWGYAVGKSRVLADAARELGISSTPVGDDERNREQIDPRVLAAAQNMAQNPADALIAAWYDPRTARRRSSREAIPVLERVAEGFPERPEPAASLCVACSVVARFDREAEQYAMSPRGVPSTPFKFARPDEASNMRVLQTLLRAARSGEQVDAGNGFFPCMEAAALFALHRDDEALLALHRAGGCRRWDDYVLVEPVERLRLQRIVLGRQPNLVSELVWESILLPHFSVVRGAVRVAVFHAIQAERRGDYRTGLAIRRDVVQCADVMGRNSRTLIQTLVAAAITSIGLASPGGRAVAGTERMSTDEAVRRREEAFLAYVRQREGPAAAQWFEDHVRRAHEAREIARVAVNNKNFRPRFWRGTFDWLLATSMLAACLWCMAVAVLALALRVARTWTWQSAAAGLVALGALAWSATCVSFNVHQLAALTAANDELTIADGAILWALGRVGLLTFAAGALVICEAIFPLLIGYLAGRYSGAGAARGAIVALVAASLVYCVIFSASCWQVAAQEDRIGRILRQILQNEALYAARLTGKSAPW